MIKPQEWNTTKCGKIIAFFSCFFNLFLIILIRKRVSLPPVVGSCSPCPPWVSAVVTLAGGWTYPSSASIRAGEGGGDPQPRISRVCCRSWSASAEPSASSCRSGNRSWPGWQPAQTRDCRSWRTLRTEWRLVLFNQHVILSYLPYLCVYHAQNLRGNPHDLVNHEM